MVFTEQWQQSNMFFCWDALHTRNRLDKRQYDFPLFLHLSVKSLHEQVVDNRVVFYDLLQKALKAPELLKEEHKQISRQENFSDTWWASKRLFDLLNPLFNSSEESNISESVQDYVRCCSSYEEGSSHLQSLPHCVFLQKKNGVYECLITKKWQSQYGTFQQHIWAFQDLLHGSPLSCHLVYRD